MGKYKIDKGNILISQPFLGDPNFERSVVLLCEHNETGTFGFVLNQLTELSIKQVWEGHAFSDIPVYIGGPVEQNTLHFIHRLNGIIEDGVEISKGLFWGGDYEQVKSLINLGNIQPNDIRFFLGYSGWSPNQLEREMEDKAWIISQTNSSFIFDTPSDQFWRSILKNMGGKHKMLANYPIDPRLN